MRLLFRALELHQPNEKVIPEIFETLVTTFINRDQPKQAYIWLKVYQLVSKKNKGRIKLQLKQYQNAYDLDVDFLDKVANNTLDNIVEGKFKAPKH